MPADILTDGYGNRLSSEYHNLDAGIIGKGDGGESTCSCNSSTGSCRSLSDGANGTPPSTVFPHILSPSQSEASAEPGNGTKKRSNVTDKVRVPTSEHVAEIVGRQGCKIKALRAKTNTYIKTPVRGEEPVFVVTGRQEDVSEVRREILSAAEHFSQIRVSRRGAGVGESHQCPAAVGAAEQVREKVQVPFWVVGLVVGPKGTTIRRIQQETQTYIVTPGKEKEPVFEILGTAENVARARQEIESYIAVRMKARQNYSRLGSSCTKLDISTDSVGFLPMTTIGNSSQTNSSLCLLEQKLKNETVSRNCIQKDRNWKNVPGYSSRPVSFDMADFCRRFPIDETLPDMHHLFRGMNETPQKSLLGMEALITHCLRDLSVESDGVSTKSSVGLQFFPYSDNGSDLFAVKPSHNNQFSFNGDVSEATIPFHEESLP